MSDKKIEWKTVLRISSKDLFLIEEKNDLLAAYKGIEELVYEFAQEVNQICVKFFKDNSFINDQFMRKSNGDTIPDSFWVFNMDVLSYYNIYDAEWAFQNVLIQKKSILQNGLKDICDRLTKETNFQDKDSQELSMLFQKAEWFYNKICKKSASLELDKKYEKLNNYFNQVCFDVFVMFDLSPLYLCGEFNKNYQKFQEEAKKLDEWIKEADELKNNPNATEEEQSALNDKLADAIPSVEYVSQQENGWEDKIDLYKKIPLNGVQFFRLLDDGAIKEYTLAELQKEHLKVNQ